MEYFKISIYSMDFFCSLSVRIFPFLVLTHIHSLACTWILCVQGKRSNNEIVWRTAKNEWPQKNGMEEQGSEWDRRRRERRLHERAHKMRLRKNTTQQWRRRLDIIMCLLLFIITVLLLNRRHYFVVQNVHCCTKQRFLRCVAARSQTEFFAVPCWHSVCKLSYGNISNGVQ